MHQAPSSAIETITRLGAGGMSSDQSEGELKKPAQRQLWTKALPWRNPELTSWLHQIDGLPDINILLGLRRHRSIPRKMSALVSTMRAPPQGLPRSFYSATWLSQQDYLPLDLLDEDLTLPTIVALSPSESKGSPSSR